jgi:thiol-disulfide isomerase/thioredoxin
MLKRIYTPIFFIFITSLISAQGIEFFHGTFQEALAKAKTEEKVLFIDAFTKWCGPCKKMSKFVFTEEKVGSYFNKNFINLKLDMEEQDGLKFGKKYPVTAYPTLIFMDGDGKVIKKVKGAQQPDGLINIGKQALQGFDQSAKYAELYDEGNREFNTVYKYIKALNSAGKPSLKIANDFLNSDPDLTPDEIALFTFEAATEADSRIFDLMLENKQSVLAQVSPEEYKAKVVEACSATLNKALVYDMEMLKEETHAKCKEALGDDEAKLENLKFDMIYYSQLENVEAYLKAADEIIKKYAKKDISLYTYVVEDINKKFKGVEKAIEKGVKYSKELFKKEDSADNAVLYVRLLIEAKDNKEALKVIDKTIEKVGEDSADGQKLKSIRRYVESLEKSDS